MDTLMSWKLQCGSLIITRGQNNLFSYKPIHSTKPFWNQTSWSCSGSGLAAKKSWKAAVSLRSRRLQEMGAERTRGRSLALSVLSCALYFKRLTQARRLYVLFLKFGFSRNLGVPFKFTSIKMEHSWGLLTFHDRVLTWRLEDYGIVRLYIPSPRAHLMLSRYRRRYLLIYLFIF